MNKVAWARVLRHLADTELCLECAYVGNELRDLATELETGKPARKAYWWEDGDRAARFPKKEKKPR